MTSMQDPEQVTLRHGNMLQEELMGAHWQTQQYQSKSAHLTQSLQQAYHANWTQNAIIVQLQAQLRNSQTLYCQSQKRTARLQAQIRELNSAYQQSGANLDRAQMDKEAAWQAVQKIGELFTGTQLENGKALPNLNDNAELRNYAASLVVDNKRQESEINHLKGLVEKLKRFRSIEQDDDADSTEELGPYLPHEGLALMRDS